MDERELEDLVALLPPLLQTLDGLALIARYLNPAQYGEVMDAVGAPDAALRAIRPRLDDWPEAMAPAREALATAADEALTGFAALRAAADEPDGMGALFRALRHLPRAQEALYPLAGHLPPIGRYFLDPAQRGDADRLARLAEAGPTDSTGVLHVENEPGSRGGFSAYVPEDYAPDQAWPLVFALHGGSGNGRAFLWSWLATARSRGAILIAPTATGRTWAISGEDADTPNLARMVELARRHWNIDPRRMLLSGMSDGGTFSYVSGLEPGSPFTHLAPTAAAFHPMMAQFAGPDRLRGLPIHITHGALDWMFEVGMARDAQRALAAAGANVTYREVADLSHTFPRELNGAILDWMDATAD